MNRGDETHYEAQLESLQKFFEEFMLKQFEYDFPRQLEIHKD